MKASPWETRTEGEQGPLWERYGRLIMAVTSGILLAGGFVTHWVLHGGLVR